MEVFDETYFTTGDDVIVSPDNDMSFASELSTSTFTALNQSSPTGTVSPTDLSLQPDLTMSAPNSTAFPNLSTPGSHALESPYWGNGSSSLDTSPWQGDGQLDAGLEGVDWSDKPLFADDLFAPGDMSHDTPVPSVEPTPMSRQQSNGSPGRSARNHSVAAGVKPSKSRKPLPAIIVREEDDKDTAKRKKNTAAARKSRERRNNNMLEQAEEIARLTAEMEEKDVVIGNQVDVIKKLQRLVSTLGGDPAHAGSF